MIHKVKEDFTIVWKTKNIVKTKKVFIRFPDGKILPISYDDFIYNFGKILSKESMYSLKKIEQQHLLGNLKISNVSTTSI